MDKLVDPQAGWAEAKRLSFKLDELPKLKGPSLRKIAEGVVSMVSAESTPELDRFHSLLYELEIVSPANYKGPQARPEFEIDPGELSDEDLLHSIMWICRADRFSEGELNDRINDRYLTNAFRHAYRRHICTADGWPANFPVESESQVREGIPVFSLSGAIEGRTTGSREKCRAHGCPGWFIGVLWETGQQKFICSEGWHYDATNDRVEVIGGGEITARYINPDDPAPRERWPSRESLIEHKGWRA